MANFQYTSDYLDSILLLSGETSNGNSSYEARALHYLNQIQNAIIAGGNEFNLEVDELWPWALVDDPIFIELQPEYNTGTLSFTNDSVDGTFSSAPAASLKDYHFKITGQDEVYQIKSHTGGATAFTIDSPYVSATASSLAYKAFKLDYELVPSSIAITDRNNKITFTETTAATEIVATITVGAYSIADLLAEIKTRMDAAGASVYTVAYSSVTRKFSITSDLAGGDNLFSITGASGTEATLYASALPTLGYAFKDYTGAGVYTSERALASIAKLSQPMHIHTGFDDRNEIYGVDKLRFSKDYPLSTIREGNPTRFCILEEGNDGFVKVRFNRYPEAAQRVEINYVPTPLNLYDTSTTHPLIPRKYARVLDWGGAAYLMSEKNDNRAPQYFQMAGQLLESMMKNYRKTSERIGENFGEIVAREDLISNRRRNLLYGEPD